MGPSAIVGANDKAPTTIITPTINIVNIGV